MSCDKFLHMTTVSTPNPATYYQLGSGTCPFIDHFCVSDSIANRIVCSFIMDSGENLSDHMPLCLRLSLNFPIRAVRNVSTPLPKSLRWDKADLI